MDDRIVISFEIDAADHERLSEIARWSGKTFDEVAVAALRARVEDERDFQAGMAEGLADVEAGRTISHEEMLARSAERRRRWVESRAA